MHCDCLMVSVCATVLGLFGMVCSVDAAAGQPSLRVSVREGAANTSARVIVEADDAQGLDSLEISCPEADAAYRMNLSGPKPNLSLQRTFTLAELFPDLDRGAKLIHLKITVRNTRGITASSDAAIRVTSK